MSSPFGWADWARFEKRPEFVCWAEPAPEKSNEDRYAVVNDGSLIRWCAVSPNPDVPVRESQGAFYSDMHPDGAVAAAMAAAMVRKAKVRAFLAEYP